MPDSRSNPGYNSPTPRYPGSFLLAVREALAEVKWQARKWLGGAVECFDQDGQEQVLGLENLYRRLRREDRAEWPKLIVEMLRTIPASAGELVALAEAAERILPRVGPPLASVMPPDREIWFQPIVGKSLGVTLVVDSPNTMSYVTLGQVADSGRDGTAWLETALGNLRLRTPEDVLQVAHEESGLLQCEIGDAYDSSRSLIVEHLLPLHAENGYFIAIPGRDQLLVLPVTKTCLEYVAWLRMIATKAHQTVPYPISPEVFWVQGGVWRVFDIEIDKDKITVAPPPEFEEVLRRLTAKHDEAAPES
jgi:hypothetical protein